MQSRYKALRYSTYDFYLDQLGWATGFEQKLTSYCFRRGTGNAVDRATTTAVRDQILRYNPQTGVFSGSYINEKVRFIVQDAVLDQPTNVGFLRAFTHMSLTCDPRAPVDVPEEIINALPPDAEITELEKERKALYAAIQSRYKYVTRASGTDIGKEYQQLLWKLASLEKRHLREIKKEFRQDYFYCIHDEELERQMKKVVTPEYVKPVIEYQLSNGLSFKRSYVIFQRTTV
ncbi:hypothetical protein EAE96_004447 [Botrytis aclada]|nr:hypothetical protein EAE96_004447 [Botrytis aclada]